MFKRFLVTSVLSLSLLAAFSPRTAWASDEPEHATTHGEDKAAGDAHGDGHAEKPALLDWDIGTAFWSIVVFGILLAILRKAAWNPILTGLQGREKYIRDTIADAKREREDSGRVLQEYTDKLNHAREEATAIVEEGRRDAEEVRKRIQAEAKKEADAIVARAKRDIELARDDAVKKLYSETVLLATNVAGKIVRKDLSKGDHAGLLDEALSEMGKMN
jgi:F-type H+-transporting ATPase subunit b